MKSTRFIFLFLIIIPFKVFAVQPILSSVKASNLLAPQFKSLAGEDVLNASYMTEDGPRKDKVFYGIKHSYRSSFKVEDINFLLDPSNGRLPHLFNDQLSLAQVNSNLFRVDTSIRVLIDTLKINNNLDYSSKVEGDTVIHNYNFRDFNMFFTSSKIRVEVKEMDGDSHVKILQIATIKGSSYDKLKRIPFGTSSMEKKLLANIKKFHQGTGGL